MRTRCILNARWISDPPRARLRVLLRVLTRPAARRNSRSKYTGGGGAGVQGNGDHILATSGCAALVRGARSLPGERAQWTTYLGHAQVGSFMWNTRCVASSLSSLVLTIRLRFKRGLSSNLGRGSMMPCISYSQDVCVSFIFFLHYKCPY
jgi:hypothetical protein